MKLTKTLRMFGIVAALLGTAATQSFALPANEVETEYFSDAQYTNEVGYVFRGCSGDVYREGTTGKYKVTSSTPCNTSGPIEIACYFDGRLTVCPPNICDTELVTCN
jgi:hypothetical protein